MKISSLLLLAPLVLCALSQDEPKPATAVVGKAAPTFTLNDHTGAKVAVGGESKTWQVIACYPKAMTGG